MIKTTRRLRRKCDILTRSGRRAAWFDFYFKDHQFLRVWWRNVHEISDGVWRSNQPCPSRLAGFKRRGIKTVITLRGSVPRSYNLFEKEACAALDMDMRVITGLTARELVPAGTILSVMDQIAAAPKPLVMHCKSGADRTGFAAALYLILYENRPVAEAAKQLASKYIHFKHTKSGVLDHVFRVYLRDAEPRGLGFRDWLETEYDPAGVEADFRNWRKRAERWAR